MMVPWDRQNEAQRKRTIAAAKRAHGRAPHAHPAWAHLVREAREKGWPVAFEADLWIHDRDSLARAKREAPFLWAVGPSGTQLTWIDVARPMSEHDARDHVAYLEDQRPHMLYWDGRDLFWCTRHDARAVLAGVTFGDLDRYF